MEEQQWSALTTTDSYRTHFFAAIYLLLGYVVVQCHRAIVHQRSICFLRLYSKDALNGSYYITSCILQSLF